MLLLTNTEELFMQLINEGVYKVDDNNYIWQLKKQYRDKYGRKSYKDIKPKRAEVILTNGHSAVRINIDNETFICRTARFLWRYHNGKIPDNMYVVNVGDIENVSMDNIKIMTATEIRELIKTRKGDGDRDYFKHMNNLLDKK